MPSTYHDSVDPLVTRWGEFVDCRKRLIAEAPFLDAVFARFGPPPRRLLDAAMGMGCEVVYLTLAGDAVVGNEINPRLAELAVIHAKTRKVQIETTAYDWREFDSFFPPDSFDGIVLLGNSFSLLLKEEDHRRAASALYAACRPGGVLVIDQRNYDYILSARTSILNGQFRYSRRIMYCGIAIRGYPIAIDTKKITFVYEDTSSKMTLGHYDMYPFTNNQLPNVFLDAGFTKAERYSDFDPGYDGCADYFTFVITK
jgi:SAM-dependent methyltransferase